MRVPIAVSFLICISLCAAPAQVAIPTAQYEPGRTNANLAEFTLTPERVASGRFGKLFSRKVDNGVYALPLIVPNLSIGAESETPRDVMYVATMANTVYAFDAADPAASDPIWSRNLGLSPPVKLRSWWVQNHFGIMGTPVADLETKTLYLVAKIQNSPSDAGLYLFAIDMMTGETKFSEPQRLTFPDEGGEIVHVAGAIQRAALLLDHDTVYVAVANIYQPHLNTRYQEGYVQSFDAHDLTRLGSLQITPTFADHGKGGVWQAGRGLTADADGNVFVVTAGGHYDGVDDWGASVLKLAPRTLKVIDSFTPSNWEYLWHANLDPSANGSTLIPGTDLLFAGGKEGVIYLLDQKHLGGLESETSEPLQRFRASQGCALHSEMPDCAQTLGTAFWQGDESSRLYVWDHRDVLRGYVFDSATERFSTKPYSTSIEAPGLTGGPSVSSAGGDFNTAIVWAITTDSTDTTNDNPGTLRAFSAKDLSVELYNSDTAAGDEVGVISRMATPVVANGRVYVPTQSHQIQVYGLK